MVVNDGSTRKCFEVVQDNQTAINCEKKESLMKDFDERTIKQLVWLLKPFKHIMKIIQGGKSPSLHMVLMSTITLREAFSSSDALVNYNAMHCRSDQPNDIHGLDEDPEFELDGEFTC